MTTAVLNELRRLEAARKRGEMSEIEFLHARSSVMEQIEDAEYATGSEPARPRSLHDGDVWNLVLFMFAGFGAVTFVIAWVLGDLTLALTVSTTLLAAGVIAAARKLD